MNEKLSPVISKEKRTFQMKYLHRLLKVLIN